MCFTLRFEDVDYLADPEDLGRELDEASAASLNGRLRSGGMLPDGIVGIMRVRISVDDQDFTG
jgi:hypothetical protein